MSMVFRFRMLSDENDNFVRDYEVLYDTTLLDFHNFILRSLEYEDCMASFFTADDRWEKQREFTFMDMETYDQVALNSETVGDALKFVKENEVCKICSTNGGVFAVEPPLFVELEITETEPGFKGDTATGASKPATVETGAVVYVPLFVNQGDKIKIDTRTGEYLSRA